MWTFLDLEKRGGSSWRNVVMDGASGASHEIDLVLEVPLEEKTVICLVECKGFAKPAPKLNAAAFLSVVQDLNALRAEDDQMVGIMISRNGFDPGAVAMGKYYHIILLEVRIPDEKEWKEYVRGLREAVREKTRLRMGKGPWGDEAMGVTLLSNVKVEVEPMEEGARPPWPTDTYLGFDPNVLYLQQFSLAKLVYTFPRKPGTVHREERISYPGMTLRHSVYDMEFPVKAVVYRFDDLSDDAMDNILYGRKRPDWLITNRTSGSRFGIWNGRVMGVRDPIKEFINDEGDTGIILPPDDGKPNR